MSERLTRGEHGEPLPSGATVFRLAKVSSDGQEALKASPAMFTLSTRDRETPLQGLSVWVNSLTTADQARSLMQGTGSAYRLVLHLNVDDVRAIRPDPSAPEALYLDVVWDHLVIDRDGESVPCMEPGAEGHSGITGLGDQAQPSGLYRRSLRSQLTDLVNQRQTITLLSE